MLEFNGLIHFIYRVTHKGQDCKDDLKLFKYDITYSALNTVFYIYIGWVVSLFCLMTLIVSLSKKIKLCRTLFNGDRFLKTKISFLIRCHEVPITTLNVKNFTCARDSKASTQVVIP